MSDVLVSCGNPRSNYHNKEALITYNFENFAIDMPRARSGREELGKRRWTINGKIIIKAEAHKDP